MKQKRKTRFEDLPYRLTPDEIKALREDLKQAHAEATRIFAEYKKREANRAKPKAKRKATNTAKGCGSRARVAR